MQKYQTEQELFWQGLFGDEYIERNHGDMLLATKIHLFSKALSFMDKPLSFLELGANIGLNLRAIKSLRPDALLSGIEINRKAAEACKKIAGVEVFEQSILNFSSHKKWDLTFSSGVLIHINPDYLHKAYEILYKYSGRYIFLSEYYNPTPIEILYRGNERKLFKRDFAGELMDIYADLRLINYGFVYHRDKQFPGDDFTWFLLEKTCTSCI